MASGRTRWGDLIVGGGARREEVRRRHGNGLDTIEVDRGGNRLILTFLEHAPGNVHPANIRIEGPRGAAVVSATSVRRGTEDDPRLEDRLLVTLTGPGGPGAYTLRLVERAAGGLPGWAALQGLDPRFAQAGFAFDLDLPVRGPGAGPAAAAGAGAAQASYLARDYEGLRQLIVDRLAQTMPAWTETHAADIGVTLVEILAYVGDDLSYYQDTVATEAYLATARQRISVRRHARLVDYLLGEGCQARAWVCLTVSDAARLPLRDLAFAADPGLAAGAEPVLSASDLGPGGRVYTPVRAWHGAPPPAGVGPAGPGPQVAVSPAHNEVALWSWGERDSWLRAGATTAVLADEWTDDTDHGESGPRALSLQAGDVVVFEAITGRGGTGPPDRAQRHPVRLTAVHRSVDRLYDQPLLEVTWSEAEALPFELQVSAAAPDDGSVTCAVARGNTVLVGDGAVLPPEVLPAGTLVLSRPQLTWACPYPEAAAVARHQARLLSRLPDAWREQAEEWRRAAAHGEALGEQRRAQLRRLLGEDVLVEFGLAGGGPEAAERDAEGLGSLLADAERLLAPRIRRLAVLAALARASGPLEPVLLREVADDWGHDLARPLSSHEPATWGPAAEATSQDPRQARPLLQLAPADASAGGPWTTVRDLVGSMPGSRQVMVEVDEAGLAHLRFSRGDQPTGPVTASYQAGQGSAGNVPAEAINAIIAQTPAAAATAAVVQSVRNSLPATGGTDPESVSAARTAVPGAFLAGQPRALAAADYTALAEQVTGVRRAATVLRWTGRRYLADVTVQPAAGEDPSQELFAAVHEALWPARRIGQDLWVRPPRYRPLVIGLDVDVGADVVRADVLAALAALLGSGRQADGTPGLFSPERLGFGQPVYASPIVAAVQDLPGVEAVVLTRFGFLAPPGVPAPPRLPERLRLRDCEIARLDNDPLAPEHGYATVNLRGGR